MGKMIIEEIKNLSKILISPYVAKINIYYQDVAFMQYLKGIL